MTRLRRTHATALESPRRPEIRTVNTASRHHRTLVAGVAVSAVLLAAAPAARAAEVTNPADNPAPITVKIDGQTYTDGLDTLPGYDDHACTPIPNVEYDFPGNQILYYSSEGDLLKTAKWIEWDRISSYKTWKDQQTKASATPAPSATTAPSSSSNSSSSSSSSSAPSASTGSASAPESSSASTSAPASSGSAATTTAPSGSTTTTSGSTTTTPSATKSKTPKADARRAARKARIEAKRKAKAAAAAAANGSTGATGATGDSGAVVDPKTGKTTDGKPAETKADGTTPADGEATEGTPIDPTSPDAAIAGDAGTGTGAAEAKPLSEKVTEGAGKGAGNTRLAGVGILGALSLAGFGLLSGNFARRGLLGLKS